MNSNRLAATTSIGAVHLQVSDLQRSLSFYRDLLGFRVIRSEGLDAWLSATGEEPDLIRLTELAGAGRPPPRATGLFHVAYRAPDRAALGRWLHRLLDTKTTLQGASDHGVSEALYLADPDGLGVELYCDRPRDRWPFRGEYVAMVSEHLDTADLLAQGEGQRWDGADPASDIGHVHLCVSSLEGAESFYVDTLGFDIMQRDFPGALFLAARGYHHHLGANIWRSADAAPAPEDVSRLVSYTLGMSSARDVAAVRARLETAGAPVEENARGIGTRDNDGMTLIVRVSRKGVE